MKFKLLNIAIVTSVLLLGTLHAQTRVKSSRNPVQIDNRFRLAQTYERAGELEKAKELYLELYSENPANYKYFDALNKIYLRLKQYDKSIDLIEKKFESNKTNVSYFALLGNTYYISGDTEKAYEIWDSALDKFPRRTSVYRVIANSAIENRAYEKAIEIYEKAEKIADDPIIFAYDLAHLYSAVTEYKKATEKYCYILQRQPTQIENIKRRIANYFGRYATPDLVIETVENYYNKTSLPVFLDLLGSLYTMINKYDKALSAVVELDKIGNHNGMLIYRFAQKVLREGKITIARKSFKYILENYPESEYFPKAEIGFAFTEEEELEKAEIDSSQIWKPYFKLKVKNPEAYRRLIKSYERIAEKYENGKIYIEALFRMGKIYAEKLNENTKADSLFGLVVSASPFSEFHAPALLEIAELSITENNFEKAESNLKKILSDKNAEPELKNKAAFMLAKIDYWNGRFTQASKKLSKLVDNLKDDNANDAIELSLLINTLKTDSLNLMAFAKADLYTEQKNYALAAAEYQKLSENKNLFLLRDFAELKYIEMLIALDYLPQAVSLLTKITSDDKFNLYSDKFLYLFGNVNFYGLNNKERALEAYEKLLDNFPNSLYLDEVRQIVKTIKTESKTL